MQFNWRKVALAFFFLLIVYAYAYLNYPTFSRSKIYDYDRHEYPVVRDDTAFYVMGVGTIIILVWACSGAISDKVNVMFPHKIVELADVQQVLSINNIGIPVDFKHIKYLGEYKIGHLWLCVECDNLDCFLCTMSDGTYYELYKKLSNQIQKLKDDAKKEAVEKERNEIIKTLEIIRYSGFCTNDYSDGIDRCISIINKRVNK